MKAIELMLGDLITFKDCQYDDKPTIVKIVQINANGDALVSIDGDDALDEIAIDDEVVGIPLTPEILEKNGFNDECAGTYGNDDAYFIPTYRGFDAGTWETHIEPTEGIGDFSGKLRYVHELQHALRLCGIDKEIIL